MDRDRRILFALAALAIFLDGVVGSQTALAAKKPQWPQCGYGTAGNGQSPYAGPRVNRLKWIFPLDGWGCSPVVGADGTVYVGTNSGTLYAIATDGSSKWSLQWPIAEMQRPSGISDEEWSERIALGRRHVGQVFSCAVGPDGTLYAAQSGKDDPPTKSRYLIALDGQGKEKWRYSVGLNNIVTRITVDADGTLYFGTSGRSWAYHALKPDGKLKWSSDFARGEALSSAAIGKNGLAYIGGTRLRALDVRDGRVVHEYPEPVYSPGLEFGPAVGPDGTVYVASGVHSRSGHFLYAFDPDLTPKWKINAGVMEMTPAISADGTVYIHNWGDVLGVTDGEAEIPPGVHAINPDGTVKWSLPGIMKAPPEAWDDNPEGAVLGSDSSPIVDADGVVYFGSDIGRIFAIKPNGTLLWQLDFGGEFDTRPAIDAEGTLYICHAGGPGARHDGKPRCYAVSSEGTIDPEAPARIARDDEIRRLQEELQRAREAGNLVEVDEIREILEDLRAAEEEKEKHQPRLENLPHSSSRYRRHRWHIDSNGLLWWDDEPYVRFGFTGNGDPPQMMQAGFDQFTLMPSEEWPISGPDAGIVQSVNETSDELEKAGATYYATLNAFWPWRYGDLIADSDKAAVFVRDVHDVTEHAGRRLAVDVRARLSIDPAEYDEVTPARIHAVLFDLKRGTRHDLSDRVESVTPVVAEPGAEARRETDDERHDGRALRVRFKPIRFPESASLRLVLAMDIRLAEVPGVHGLPPLWKPGIRQFYRRSLEAFRPTYAKPGLRGLQFGDEINTFSLSLLSARTYLDLRRDAAALKAYRDWLARRFGDIDELNRHLGSRYASFDRVKWHVPLHPFSPELAATDAAAEREESWADAGTTWGLADTVEQVRALSEVQDEFRIWLCGHWLAEYAKLAKEVFGPVPVFVCSASIGGDANQYLAMHRWALREGVDGLIRNHYGHGGQEERHTLAGLARWMAKVQQESGCTKHLWANEVGYVRPHMTDDEWAEAEAEQLGAEDSFGSQWAFPSRQSLREMLVLLTQYGYAGFNRFLMNPSASRAAREVEWMAELRPEIVSSVVQAKEPPAGARQPTRGRELEREVRELRGTVDDMHEEMQHLRKMLQQLLERSESPSDEVQEMKEYR